MTKTRNNTHNKKRSVILTVLLLALVCYFVATLVSLQANVKAQEAVNASYSEQYEAQKAENNELQAVIDSGNEEDYIERIAREEYGYVKPDERVYYDSAYLN